MKISYGTALRKMSTLSGLTSKYISPQERVPVLTGESNESQCCILSKLKDIIIIIIIIITNIIIVIIIIDCFFVCLLLGINGFSSSAYV
jgi:hypothetical protein